MGTCCQGKAPLQLENAIQSTESKEQYTEMHTPSDVNVKIQQHASPDQQENIETKWKKKYNKDIDALKQEINVLNKQQEQEVEALKEEINIHLDTIKSLKHSKPSFHKNTEKQKEIKTLKDELKTLKDELKTIKDELKTLEHEMKEEKEKHNTLITKTKTMNDDEISALQNRLKRIQSQHNVDKETYGKELKLLKEKDPAFIQKIYKDRDQLQSDLIKLKKLLKEREHTLRIQLEALERKKLKAEDLADLKDKNEDELREIIEKLRFTNHDLNDVIHENRESADKREKEFEEQIVALNRIIKHNKLPKTKTKRNSNVVALNALSALSAAPTNEMKNNTFGGIASSLAAKLPFGAKKKIKKDNTQKIHQLLHHKDDIKGKIGGLLDAKKAESGQGPITDDTKSILGMIDTMNKYEKMKKIGMPMASIKNKMKLDGFTDSQIAKFAGEPPQKPLNGIDLSKYNLKKYEKMKKIGMPQTSVQNKMKMDGIDNKVIATFFGEKIDGISVGKPMEAPTTSKPDLKKYKKMKKIGMPSISVKNKMKMDGIHPYWIRDLFGEAQPMIEEEQVMAEPSPKPDLKKYKRMKKVGLPPASIRNKMRSDGIHQYWICVFFGDPLPKIKSEKKKQSKKRNVKPLHWRKKSECDWNQTIWQNIDNIIDVNNVDIKVITTQKLITSELTALLEKAFTSIRVKKDKKKSDKNKNEEKEITLIAPKRAFNMIVGLRQFEKLGINDIKMRNYLLKLDDTKLNIEMLENLSKFVPNNEELDELRNFKGKKERLGRAEKFVDAMTCLVDIKLRIDLWQFKMKFKSNVFEIESRINQITTALNTLKTSSQIAAFLKVCLIIGNFMNEGTNRGAAKGIKLESIDRFGSLKTADNKMTMLMFIMDHVEKHKIINNIDIFPNNVSQIVENSKKIEAKTIRDGVNDMKDALERIGKRIARAARNLHQIQAHFHKSAGNALKVLGKLRKNATKLHHHSDNHKKDKENKKIKQVAFVDGLFDDDEKKAPKFIIIDPKYKGNKKIRKRKERDEIPNSADYKTMDELLTRGETMIESDADYSDFESGQSMPFKPKSKKHQKTETGLRRKKKKLKKVKIRRLHRIKPKNIDGIAPMLSDKTSRTIQKLRETKRSQPDIKVLSRAVSIRKIETKLKDDINAMPSDKFESVMTGFHTMACNKVEALDKDFSNLKIFAGNVAVYFGEHDDLEWEELFKLFISFFEQINKAKKLNNDLKKKEEKKRKKEERERLKKERMAKKGLKPKKNNHGKTKSNEPTNILEEIRMKNAKGTLAPSNAKNDIVGFEKR